MANISQYRSDRQLNRGGISLTCRATAEMKHLMAAIEPIAVGATAEFQLRIALCYLIIGVGFALPVPGTTHTACYSSLGRGFTETNHSQSRVGPSYQLVVSIQSEARRRRRNLTGLVSFVIFVAAKLNAWVIRRRNAENRTHQGSEADLKIIGT